MTFSNQGSCFPSRCQLSFACRKLYGMDGHSQSFSLHRSQDFWHALHSFFTRIYRITRPGWFQSPCSPKVLAGEIAVATQKVLCMLQCSSKKSVFEVKPFNIDGILHIPYTCSSLGNSLPSLRGSGSPKGTLMGLARD